MKINAAGQRGRAFPNLPSKEGRSASAAPAAPPPEPPNEPQSVFTGLVGVAYHAGYPFWEMSLDSAKRIMADKSNGMRAWAEKRLAMK